MFQQLVRIALVHGEQRDADTGRGTDLVTLQAEWLAHGFDRLVGQCRGSLRIGQVGGDYRKLVSAQAGNGVGLAGVVEQPARHRLQQGVAHGMPPGIVDVLEMIQVQKHDGNQMLGTFGLGDGIVQPHMKEGSVGEAGQRIVLGQAGQGVLDAFAFHRVANRAVEQRRANLILDEVICRAGLHCLDVDLSAVQAGQQDDRGLAAPVDGLAHQLHAVALAKTVVHQANVVLVFTDRGQTGVPAIDPIQFEAVGKSFGQNVPGEDIVVLVVLDQENVQGFGHGRIGPVYSVGNATIPSQ